MAISKNFLKSRPSCKVKFHISPEEAGDATEVFLVGDFNNWNNNSHPMKKGKNGAFHLELELPLGSDHKFRYRTNQNLWLNDPDADALVPCAFANAENFLVKV